MPPVESVIKGKLRKVNIHPGFPNPHVREAYLQPVVDESKEKFSWGSPDLDLLREYPFYISRILLRETRTIYFIYVLYRFLSFDWLKVGAWI